MVSIDEQEILAQPHIKNNDEDEVVLSVNCVSKKFCRDLKRSLFYGVQDIASEVLGLREKSDTLREQEFWALDNVSFDLHVGESLGLIGKNGSGKSTLLRIIAGLIKPDTGFVEVNGRVAPLIALGAGFNPVLTGRENIYANMSILGLSKKEIDERFDEVVEFAEIGDAIDAPVRSYSSGMAARLGFASAIHTEPDILLIDEVLAVGDIKFRAKCYRKLADIKRQGVSFILVSHNTQSIIQMCENSVYLSKGKQIISGGTYDVMTLYEKELFQVKGNNNPSSLLMEFPKKTIDESEGVDIISASFKDSNDNILQSLNSGENVYLSLVCNAHKNVSNICLHIKIIEFTGEGGTVLFFSSMSDNKSFEMCSGEHEMKLEMPSLGLPTGIYTMSIKLKEGTISTLDFIESFKFTVNADSKMSECKFYQQREWKIESKDNKLQAL